LEFAIASKVHPVLKSGTLRKLVGWKVSFSES
jgi:hypothetical protein